MLFQFHIYRHLSVSLNMWGAGWGVWGQGGWMPVSMHLSVWNVSGNVDRRTWVRFLTGMQKDY